MGGRTGKYFARGQGLRTERSVRPDREPNILPSGPTLLSQWAFFYMDTFCWKFWKFCLNQNSTRFHKIRRQRARNNCVKVSTAKPRLSFISSRRTRNSKFIKKTDSFSHFCFSIPIHAKKLTESWHETAKNVKAIKNLASDKSSLHTSLKLFTNLLHLKTRENVGVASSYLSTSWPGGVLPYMGSIGMCGPIIKKKPNKSPSQIIFSVI